MSGCPCIGANLSEVGRRGQGGGEKGTCKGGAQGEMGTLMEIVRVLFWNKDKEERGNEGHLFQSLRVPTCTLSPNIFMEPHIGLLWPFYQDHRYKNGPVLGSLFTLLLGGVHESHTVLKTSMLGMML